MTEEKKLLSRTQLKAMRLKTAPGQEAEKQYYSQRARAWVDLYDPDKAVPMKAYKAPTDKQAAALARGRLIASTFECQGCKQRIDNYAMHGNSWCYECHITSVRIDSAESARRILASDPLFLDVETTGLSYHDDEIVEIAVLDADGNVLLDELVKPSGTIPAEATAVHGITPEHVQDAPEFSAIAKRLQAIIDGRKIVCHNANFDRPFVQMSLMKAGQTLTPKSNSWSCSMLLLTQENDGRWPSLDLAMSIADASSEGLGEAHSARSDAEACRRIIHALAGRQDAFKA